VLAFIFGGILKKFILKFKHLFIHFENRIEEISDWTAEVSASPWFLILHAIWWTCWIVFKVEPFPYGLLTMILSLEAIILSALLLSSSNREGDVEKKIARKTLNNTKETNWMTEEILEAVRDLQEDVRYLRDEEEEI
jgi:uncharacterized membrane protein